jgi:hypothetical protein
MPCDGCLRLFNQLSFTFLLLSSLNTIFFYKTHEKVESVEDARKLAKILVCWFVAFGPHLGDSISIQSNAIFKMQALLGILCLFLISTASSYQLCGSSALSCLPCPTQCSACSDQSTCSACSSQYTLATICIGCPDFCLSCNSTVCLACMNPYVLVNGSCSLCVISQAASCSSTVAATSCHSGYYLSESYCKTCLLNCLACSSAYDCSSCSQGYYLNSSIVTCMPCPGNCAVCDQYSPTLCSRCNNNYLLQSDRTCLKLLCQLDNCDYCSA